MSNEKYIISKLDGTEYCVKNGQFSRHLKTHDITFKEYWETYVTLVTPVCPFCLSEVRFRQGTRSYSSTCNARECINRQIINTKQSWTPEQKQQDSKNKKMSANHRTQEEVDIISDKRKATCLERYGVEYTTQSTVMKDAASNTKLERYGDAKYNNSVKSAEKNRNKTTAEQDDINQKRRVTNLDRFGVECCYLIPDVVSKSMKAQAAGKEYTTPSGKIIHIRGYEPWVLDELYAIYAEDDIYVDDIDSKEKIIIEYVNYNQHVWKYYPDIHIKSENLLIEVKSWWWYNGNGDLKYQGRFINNCRKA